MQDVKITFKDGSTTTVEILSDQKPPVLSPEDLRELEVKLDDVDRIEYDNAGTWEEVEYER